MIRRITEDDAEALRRVAAGLLDTRKTVALCAYGSKVAGYAREDSDYDLILVAKNFREGVRYRYLEAPTRVSALIVDEQMLREDARTAALGEFVVGRFLNPYEAITNRDMLHEVEIVYKRRIIIETLNELASDYGEFFQDLIVPFQYFLFDKLRRRALVYPPALYSYVRTYSGRMGRENRDFAIRGFREASAAPELRRLLRVDDDSVGIVSGALKGDAFTKVLSLFSLTARGVTQYAVHGYAGRVGLGVFRTEAVSKLRRMRERVEPPAELQRPKVLLKLEEGLILDGTTELYDELAKLSGLGEGFRVEERRSGDVYTTVRIVSIADRTRSTAFVVKHFSDIRSLKWALLGLWAFTARKFSMSPLSRLHREYRASLRLRAMGIRTPKIIGVALDERVMVNEFLEGTSLSAEIESLLHGRSDETGVVRQYARVLAKVHGAGLALGDTKASNVIISGGEVVLTDLEQAVEGGDAAWDVAEFLYYMAKLSLKDEGIDKVASAFLQAYREAGEPAILNRARSLRYLAPFQPFLAPSMGGRIRELLKENAN